MSNKFWSITPEKQFCYVSNYLKKNFSKYIQQAKTQLKREQNKQMDLFESPEDILAQYGGGVYDD